MAHSDSICVILGGGGHARVLIEALRASGSVGGCVILDADPEGWSTEVDGVPVLGSDAMIMDLVERGATYFVVGVGSSEDCRPRQRLFDLGVRHRLIPLTVRHPTAIQSSSAVIAQFWQARGQLQGGGIVATVMSNLGLERYLSGLGLILERTQVGDRYVLEAMRAQGFNVGG